MTEKTKKVAGEPTQPGAGGATGSPTPLKDSRSELETLLLELAESIDTISTLLGDKLNEVEQGRLQEVQALLIQIQQEVCELREDEFNEVTKNLITLKIVKDLNIRLKSLNAEPLVLKNAFTNKDTSVAITVETQPASNSWAADWHQHKVDKAADISEIIRSALPTIVSTFITLFVISFTLPYCSLSMSLLIAVVVLAVSFLMSNIIIKMIGEMYAKSKAPPSMTGKSNNHHHVPIETLSSLTDKLSGVRLYQLLPTLTAHKISQTFECENSPFLSEELDPPLGTFIFVKDNAAFIKTCEILIASNFNFSIVKNKDAAKGYIIGACYITRKFHMSLLENSIPHITSIVDHRTRDYDELVVPKNETTEEHAGVTDNLKLYASRDFPQGVTFSAKKILLPNLRIASATIKTSPVPSLYAPPKHITVTAAGLHGVPEEKSNGVPEEKSNSPAC